jgi:surfactin synthase thioesterase subunit
MIFAMHSSAEPVATPWIAYRAPHQNNRMRLFCFPFAGGGASAYRGWGKDLPSFVDVCPIQYPGRETRISEKAITRIEPLLELAAVALLPYLDKPFCFFGHSMGGLVAFELARLLGRKYNVAPAHLFVSGFRAPQLPYHSSLRHDLPHDAFMNQLKALEGTPKAALESPELMEFLLPILRADCEVCDTYRYVAQPPLACDLSVFSGSEDAEIDELAIAEWQVHTYQAFNVRMFPGGHFYIQSAKDELLRVLGEHFSSMIART